MGRKDRPEEFHMNTATDDDVGRNFNGLQDLLDVDAVCRFFGGTRPIHPATLYRGIKQGRFPRPVKVGPGCSRWLLIECRAAREELIAGRDRNLPT
jgi:predicted DNA-binding transcriptional regulator AlpA